MACLCSEGPGRRRRRYRALRLGLGILVGVVADFVICLRIDVGDGTSARVVGADGLVLTQDRAEQGGALGIGQLVIGQHLGYESLEVGLSGSPLSADHIPGGTVRLGTLAELGGERGHVLGQLVHLEGRTDQSDIARQVALGALEDVLAATELVFEGKPSHRGCTPGKRFKAKRSAITASSDPRSTATTSLK